MSRLRHFSSPFKKFRSPNFGTAKRTTPRNLPTNPNFEAQAVTRPTAERCRYIDWDEHSGKNVQCSNPVGIYPTYCELHTILIDNLYIAPSGIKDWGAGLFAGPLGFHKNQIIGEYSQSWTRIKHNQLFSRNGRGQKVNSAYAFCDEEDDVCWDGLDKSSTIIRNANDARGSGYRNNAYFDIRKDKYGQKHVYMVASRRIAPTKQIFCDYGEDYF